MKNQKLRKKIILPFVLLAILLLIGNAEAAKFKLRVTVTAANIRLKPSLESNVISKAPRGATLNAEEKIGEWYKIKLPPDEQGIVLTGYIHQSIVEVVEEIHEEIKSEEKPIEIKRKREVVEKETEQREEIREKREQVTKKDKEKRFTFRAGIGLSFPTGDMAEYFTAGIGANVGNGYRVIQSQGFNVELFGSLGTHIFFVESYWSEASWTRIVLAADGRFNLTAVEPIIFFIQGGLGIYWDILEIYDWPFWHGRESEIGFGPRIGGGLSYRNLALSFMYHIEENKMFSIMLTAGWDF